MADTSIKISLELADKAAQKALSDFIGNTAKADAGLKKLHDSGESTFNEITVGIGKALGAYDIFAGNVAANVAVKAFELMYDAAHKLFETFVVDGVKAASEAQVAINHLNSALAQSGHYSEETSNSLQDYAEHLSQVTVYSDNQIVANAALIESMAQLDEKGLKRATTAAVNLASAYHIDLETASRDVAKAAEGNVTALQKMGIEVRKGQTDAETFANALQAIEHHTGNAATAEINTYAGSLSQAGNSFEKLQEAIGSLIVSNPIFVEIIKTANQLFQELSGYINTNKDKFKEFIATGVLYFIEAMKIATTALDVFVRASQTVIGAFQIMQGHFSAGAKNLQAFGQSGDGALKAINNQLTKFEDAATTGFAKLKTGADGSVAPINNAAGAVAHLTDEQKRAHAALEEFVQGLVKQGNSSKATYDQQLEGAKSKAEEELAIQQRLLTNKQINEQTFQERKKAIDQEYDAAEEKALDQKFVDDKVKLQAALDDRATTLGEYNVARLALEKKYVQDAEKLGAKRIKDEAADDDAIEKAKKKTAQDQIDTLNNLAQLQYSKHKEMVAVGKAAALVNIGIATYEGAIKAYNAMVGIPFVGPELGVAAAAAITAYGLEREADVAGINFATGGIVPGNSYFGDNIAANLNSREMVLTQGQQAQLFAMANGRGGSSDDLMAENNSLLRSIGNMLAQGQTINIDGREIFYVIRDGIRGGRTFA